MELLQLIIIKILLSLIIKFLSIPRASLNDAVFENALRQTLPVVLVSAPSDLGMSTLSLNASYIFFLINFFLSMYFALNFLASL